MDISNFKEILVNGYKNLHNSIVNSSAFYFLKEKYDHLNPLYRKIIHTGGLIFLVCALLYYPFSNLYSSWKNMKDFKERNTLTKDLIDLSTASAFNVSRSYTVNQDPVRFIRQKMPTLRIPKDQIEEIKADRPIPIPASLSLPVKVKTVSVKIKNLTLKEVIQYGYQMEQMSKSIKLMDIRITENPKKNNYFDVSYILSFFNLTKKSPTNEKQKAKSPNRIARKNKNSKKKTMREKTQIPSQRRKAKKPAPTSHSIKYKPGEPQNQKNKKPETLLLDLKKENVPTDDTTFKNQPSSVKRKDLLPPPPPLTPPHFNNSSTEPARPLSHPTGDSPKNKLPPATPAEKTAKPDKLPPATPAKEIPAPPIIDNVSPSSKEESQSNEQ